MELSLALEPQPTAAAEARKEIRNRLGALVPRRKVKELCLVVSELVTNSVRYGPGVPILVSVAVDENGSIRGEVEDQGDGVVAIRDMSYRDGGYGLRIVDALTDRWAVYEGSTHVWFEMAAGGSGQPT